MSFKLKISGNNTLEIHYSGKITQEEVSAVRENAIAMINSNNLSRIVCDIRDSDIDLSPVELFNFAASQKKVYPVIRRAAILHTERSRFANDLKMFLKTANRRGFKIKAFSDLNKCKTWLSS